LKIELELIEVYRYEGIPGKRFRFQIRNTNIYINVSADDVEEALKKAEDIIKHLELDKKLVKRISGDSGDRNAK